MVKRERSQIVNSLQRNGEIAFNLDEKIYLTKDNFDFAVSMDYVGSDSDAIEPDEYFTYNLYSV